MVVPTRLAAIILPGEFRASVFPMEAVASEKAGVSIEVSDIFFSSTQDVDESTTNGMSERCSESTNGMMTKP
jgi:hypothetical protein